MKGPKSRPRDVTADDMRQLRPKSEVSAISAELAKEAAIEHAAHAAIVAEKRASAEASGMSVGHYFKFQLGHALGVAEFDDVEPYPASSPFHQDFNLLGGCGNPCANAIDSAALLLFHVKQAFGEDTEEENAVVEAVSRVVGCYVYG